MKLSVLLPVYNGVRYLGEAIDSVLAQTYEDFELIVVDDGSTDATPDVLARYTDPRLRVIRTPHQGLIAALARAAAEAQTPYLARMDADDRSAPERFARQIQVLDEQNEVALVTCYAELIDPDGTSAGIHRPRLADDLLLDLAAGNSIVHGSVMMRRRDFVEAGGYNHPPEDYALWIEMARLRKRFVVLPEVLYAFRTHGDRYSITHASQQAEAIVAVGRPLLQQCMRTRDRTNPYVHGRLLRGWGWIGSAALLSNQRRLANRAAKWVLRLDTAAITQHSDGCDAFDDAAEALVWAGCRRRTALQLRLRQWRRQPFSPTRLRDLALCFPIVASIHRRLRKRESCEADADSTDLS